MVTPKMDTETMLLEYIRAQQNLLVAYRIGGRPSGKAMDFLRNNRIEVDHLLNAR